MEQKPRYWTIKEASELLNCSVGVVQKLVRTGQLPAIRINRRVIRIAESEIEAFISKAGSTK